MFAIPEATFSYTTRPCTICGAPIVDLPEAPLCCPSHDLTRRRVDGSIVQTGTIKELVSDERDVERIGFGAVVRRYEYQERAIYGVEQLETWLDPETGQRMGEKVGTRPL
jgi:hypothetical protein